MLKKLLIIFALILLAVLAYAFTRPDTFSVSRTITINASPERVYAELIDFHAWEQWSPWAKLDPAMRTTFAGAPSGVGARYTWSGNSDVGSGAMEITNAVSPREVTIALDFTEPFASRNTTVFTLTPAGSATTVTWTMSGEAQYVTKLMTTFVSMDRMVGGDFEKGLRQLKSVVER